MTCDDGVPTALLLPASWAALALAAALALCLAWFDFRKTAVGVIVIGVLVASIWAEAFFDVNCVELRA